MSTSPRRHARAARVRPEPSDPWVDTGWRLTGPDDGPALCAVVARRLEPGIDVVLGFDPAGWLELVVPLAPDEPLAACVDLLAQSVDREWSLIVVSNRTGEFPADRPGDELVYEEMRGAVLAHDVVLLDWFVVWGTKAFSLAEFAPSGHGWHHRAP